MAAVNSAIHNKTHSCRTFLNRTASLSHSQQEIVVLLLHVRLSLTPPRPYPEVSEGGGGEEHFSHLLLDRPQLLLCSRHLESGGTPSSQRSDGTSKRAAEFCTPFLTQKTITVQSTKTNIILHQIVTSNLLLYLLSAGEPS